MYCVKGRKRAPGSGLWVNYSPTSCVMPCFRLIWMCTFYTNPSSFIILIVIIIITVICFTTGKCRLNVHRWIHLSCLAFWADPCLWVIQGVYWQYSLSHYSRNERLALQCDLISPQGSIEQDSVVFLNEQQSIWACIFAPAIATRSPSCTSWSALLRYSSLKYAPRFYSQRKQTEEHRKQGCRYFDSVRFEWMWFLYLFYETLIFMAIRIKSISSNLKAI